MLEGGSSVLEGQKLVLPGVLGRNGVERLCQVGPLHKVDDIDMATLSSVVVVVLVILLELALVWVKEGLLLVDPLVLCIS